MVINRKYIVFLMDGMMTRAFDSDGYRMMLNFSYSIFSAQRISNRVTWAVENPKSQKD